MSCIFIKLKAEIFMNKKGILSSNQTVVSFMHRMLDVTVISGCLFLVTQYNGQTWQLHHTVAVLLAIIIFHFLSEVDELYVSWRGLSIYKELKSTLLHWIMTSVCLFVSADYIYPAYKQNIAIEFGWFLSTFIGLSSYRILLRLFLKKLRSKGYNTRTVMIAGSGNLGQRLHRTISSNDSLGLKFLGFYDDNLSGNSSSETAISGDLIKLVEDCKKGGIDRVYIALPMQAESRIKWLTKELSDTTASVYLVPDIFTFELLHARSETLNGIPTISIYDSPLDGSNAVVKRLEDILFSILILLLIAPVLIAVGLAVRFTSNGPVIFKQKRYGVDGKSINVYKFRSMAVMENSDKVVQATKNDSRITPVGKFIRQTSLDELPQFLNVLQGRMSIVGPRPHAVAHNEEYRKLVDGYMLRHKVKPGITGWAQVNGWRGETDTLDKMEKRVEYDLAYIQNWSLFFDIKIIVVTVFKGFINKNAY